MCFSDILCLEVKGMFDGLKKMLGLDANDRTLKRYSQIVNEVNDLEESIAALSDEDLVREINDIRKNVSEDGQPLDEVMCRVFAIVREAARRSLGMRHFDVQIMGAIALHEGKIAEMKTGEGDRKERRVGKECRSRWSPYH